MAVSLFGGGLAWPWPALWSSLGEASDAAVKLRAAGFDNIFRRSPVFAIFLSHVVGSGSISRELNIGAGSSLDSAGNADSGIQWFLGSFS